MFPMRFLDQLLSFSLCQHYTLLLAPSSFFSSSWLGFVHLPFFSSWRSFPSLILSILSIPCLLLYFFLSAFNNFLFASVYLFFLAVTRRARLGGGGVMRWA